MGHGTVESRSLKCINGDTSVRMDDAWMISLSLGRL